MDTRTNILKHERQKSTQQVLFVKALLENNKLFANCSSAGRSQIPQQHHLGQTPPKRRITFRERGFQRI